MSPCDQHFRSIPRLSSHSPHAFALNTVTFFPHAIPRCVSQRARTTRSQELLRRHRGSHYAPPHRPLFPTMSKESPESKPPTSNLVEPLSVVGNGAPSGHRLEEDEYFEDEYEGFLNDARIVSVPLPLDLYLAQSPGGKVYVDEVVPGGNAEKVGGISVGDIVIAVSLPFGETMVPVPSSGALHMVETHIRAREKGEDFMMALIEGDIEVLSAEEPEDGLDTLTLEEMESNAKKIYINEYPYVPDTDPEPVGEMQLDLEALRQQGFDI